METEIENHTIEYHWRDRDLRHLDEDSIGQIVSALESGQKSGQLCQLSGGLWMEGVWKDVTEEDIQLFGFLNGWFD